MKKKILLVLFCAFLLCGCTIQYDFTINEDLSLDDEMYIKESRNFFENYLFNTPKEVTEMLVQIRKEEYQLNYQSEVKEDGSVTLKNHYASIASYLDQNKIYHQFFEDMKIEKNNNIITIQNVGEFIPYTEGNPNYFQVEDIDIKIKVPFKVVKHNADYVDKKTNTYIWNIKKSTMEKSFLLSFDQSKTAADESKRIGNIALGILISLIVVLIGFILWVYGRYKNFE